MHSRRSLLYDNNRNVWVKKNGENEFDVTMGAFDGAEVCELIGLKLLHLIESQLNMSSVGIYRDDGLAVIRSRSGRTVDRVRQSLDDICKSLGLRIKVDLNLKSVNYLDINLNLETGICKPYRKPNDNPVYINKSSNHPPSIINHIPKAIGKRISSISSNEQVFDTASPLYNDALNASGFTEKIEYTKLDKNRTEKQKKTRSRKVTWFNPPYSKSVKTNIGSKFLKLIDKHFPNRSKLHSIFNRNTIKISYSCMPNIKSKIESHNSKIIKKNKVDDNASKKCNCRDRGNCPLNGKCLSQGIIYQAIVTTDNNTSTYVGLTGGPFKSRYHNHIKSFKNLK